MQPRRDVAPLKVVIAHPDEARRRAWRTAVHDGATVSVVELVPDARAAHDAALRLQAHLVLWDMDLLDPDGIGLLRSLTEVADVEVVVVSHGVDRERRRRALAAGAAAVVTPGHVPGELSAVLERALSGSGVEPPAHLTVLARLPGP